jgi:ferredoxin
MRKEDKSLALECYHYTRRLKGKTSHFPARPNSKCHPTASRSVGKVAAGSPHCEDDRARCPFSTCLALKKRLQSAHGTVVCGDGGEIPMAELANKYPQNVVGKYFVDDQCIDCDLCRETAPANFKRNDDGGHSYVYKQPESPEEEALCKEAMEGCPVEAIGDDGE